MDIDRAAFDRLQRKLVPLWTSMARLTPDEQTIVVVPSLSLELPPGLGPILHLYEERYLFMLLLLRQPRARVVLVTSQPIDEQIIDYYLSLMPGVIPSHARERLVTIAANDPGEEPLSKKILDRPDLLRAIAGHVPDTSRAHLVPYVTTELEQELAMRLDIPMYGCDPALSRLGRKSGARALFAETGVPHPRGTEDVRTLDDVVDALARLVAEAPALRHAIVKHNDGVSGLGNATVELEGAGTDRAQLAERVRRAHIPAGTWDDYMATLAREGGIVEERLEGARITSPSVQLRVTPLGDLEVLSTHDQLLGGDDGQIYEGCVFPAETAYARAITEQALKVGARLTKEGVLGRFALDFVVVDDEPFAIELNLRKGGTTHPYLTLQFLTDGVYDAVSGIFRTPAGGERFLIASDHVSDPSYKGKTVADLFDVVVREGLHFDQSRQTGVVLHSMSGVTEHARLGLTAVAESRARAAELFARARDALRS
ncbi:MAG: peptide ligase PGM1-related protein [Actinomycetota bacterium]